MRAVISLGANIGEPKENLDLAISLLREATEVISVSSYLQTKPIGGPDQPDYLNAVAIVESDLPAKDLLAVLNGIEAVMGRTREIHWGPRVIDLDLIQYGGLLVNDEKLTLPHPRAHERRFVLAPWLELEPDAILLTHGRISDLLNTDLE
jgi:2-amino-4-hydroxy-6-hydroxymethyldihydropteridine diphosphokinase